MKTNLSMPDIMMRPEYRGKHLILAEGRLYTAKTGEGASEILAKLRKKNPTIVPETAFFPKAKHWIL